MQPTHMPCNVYRYVRDLLLEILLSCGVVSSETEASLTTTTAEDMALLMTTRREQLRQSLCDASAFTAWRLCARIVHADSAAARELVAVHHTLEAKLLHIRIASLANSSLSQPHFNGQVKALLECPRAPSKRLVRLASAASAACHDEP